MSFFNHEKAITPYFAPSYGYHFIRPEKQEAEWEKIPIKEHVFINL